MKNKILFVSGSPRKGNTEYILNKVRSGIKIQSTLVLLRNKNIKHCSGCLYCDSNDGCCIKDDMQELYQKIKDADLIIFGIPNYFDNVPGLLKDFMDRTNPFYETENLRNKKVILIITGGGRLRNSLSAGKMISETFVEASGMETIGIYCFKGLNADDVKKDIKSEKNISQIIKKINSL